MHFSFILLEIRTLYLLKEIGKLMRILFGLMKAFFAFHYLIWSWDSSMRSGLWWEGGCRFGASALKTQSKLMHQMWFTVVTSEKSQVLVVT